MASILYCGACTMPPEYCRFHPKYDKCLAWMKDNEPNLFAIEIKDIAERNPKIAKKAQYLWDESVPAPESKSDKSEKKSKQTKAAKNLESKINEQAQISANQMSDINAKLASMTTHKNERKNKNRNRNKNGNNSNSPSKSILKNRQNPNYAIEQQKLAESAQNSDDGIPEANELGLGAAGNRNRAVKVSRKDTKKRKRKKKQGRNRRNKRGNDEDDDEEGSDNDENESKTVKFEKRPPPRSNKKLPKGLLSVTCENRKGNKKVTVVRGYMEKTQFKESQIKSAFRKKFATSVNITFQNVGTDKGPKQVVLMGDKRYDFMKYIMEKFPKAGDLLYYKTKKYGFTPAIDPNHGFIMPPP